MATQTNPQQPNLGIHEYHEMLAKFFPPMFYRLYCLIELALVDIGFSQNPGFTYSAAYGLTLFTLLCYGVTAQDLAVDCANLISASPSAKRYLAWTRPDITTEALLQYSLLNTAVQVRQVLSFENFYLNLSNLLNRLNIALPISISTTYPLHDAFDAFIEPLKQSQTKRLFLIEKFADSVARIPLEISVSLSQAPLFFQEIGRKTQSQDLIFLQLWAVLPIVLKIYSFDQKVPENLIPFPIGFLWGCLAVKNLV